MDRLFLGLAAIAAAVAVIAGSFGAHGLRERLTPDMLAVFETAVRYHMYHALGLIAVAWAASRWSDTLIVISGWLLIAGIVIFSGSLYLLSITGMRWLGAITPIGGVAFIAGWMCLASAMLRKV
jgi:uncharacterized membrane protein YgdD (TMEM256/DUF423 family)